MRALKDYFLISLKGIGMGAADVVPGVSGGTIAFISGIYAELLESIRKFDLNAVKLATSFQFKELWKYINGTFLASLIGGILISLLTLSRIISYILVEYPIQIWSFFFGLIVISTIWMAREIHKWDAKVIASGIVGIAIAYYVTVATPTETSTALWFVFLSGAIAICAMILPGISGSFILLILGKYEYMLNAVRDLNIVVLVMFALGCVVGILSFARFVSWLLKNYHNTAIALLAGFMVGSLNKVWPWKIITEYRIDSHGIQKPFLEENVWPWTHAQAGNNPYIFQAIIFMAIGILLIVVLEKAAKRLKNKDAQAA